METGSNPAMSSTTARCRLAQEKVHQAFDTHGYQFLKPVFEALDREIPYDDLHRLRIHYLYAKNIEPPPKTDDDTNSGPDPQKKSVTE